MPGKILVITDDVFFWARILGAAKAAGRDAARIGDEAAMEAAFAAGGVDRVLADLNSRAVDVLAWAGRLKSLPAPPRLIAFGPHVDEAGQAAALAAGFDEAMPNSRFNRMLGDYLR